MPRMQTRRKYFLLDSQSLCEIEKNKIKNEMNLTTNKKNHELRMQQQFGVCFSSEVTLVAVPWKMNF